MDYKAVIEEQIEALRKTQDTTNRAEADTRVKVAQTIADLCRVAASIGF